MREARAPFVRSSRAMERGIVMRTKRMRLAIISVVLVCGVLGAAPAQAEGVLRATLANGMRVIVVPDRLAPVATTMLNYEVGSNDESITGLAHAQEHMMFRGSESLSANQLAEIGGLMGGQYDADTQDRVTQYFYTVPSRDLDLALHIEASRASGLLDSQQAWDEERGAIEQEVTQDNSSADYRLQVRAQAHLFAGTPYADPGLGTLESFGKHIQAPDLRGFYTAWYHPNNAVFIVTGDVDPQQTLAKIEQLFGAIPSAALPARRAVHLRKLTPAVLTDTSDQPYTLAQVYYRMPGYASPDYAASVVLGDVLNSQRGALYALVASGKAFAADFGQQTFLDAALGAAEVQVPASVKPQQAVAWVKGVLGGYRAHGIPADLVAAAKRAELAQAQFKRNSIEGLAEQWSQAVAVEGRSSPDDDVAAIERVSKADVDRVLRIYLDDTTATVAYAVPKNAGAVNEGAPPAHKAEERNALVPAKPEPLPDWASAALSQMRPPEALPAPVEMTLDNGITLVVQPETITPTVVVSGLIKTNPGLQEAPHRDGIASLTATLLPYGTRTYDRLQYQAQLDAIAASVDTGTSFSLSVLSKDFDRGMQLLADDELHPAFHAADFATVKQQAYQSAVAQEHAPNHLAGLALRSALLPRGDPGTRSATPQSVRNLTLDDVRAWYRSAYRPDMTTIVVVGDVAPEQARAEVEKWFGGWKAEGPKPDVDNPPVPLNAPKELHIPATGRIQDEVYLVEMLGLTRDDADAPALRLADTILGGGSFASDLYQNLRVSSSLVYYVGSELALGKTRSQFLIAYGTMPKSVVKAQELALATVRRIQDAPVGDERLQRAKSVLLSGVPLKAASFQGVADKLLGYASEGQPLDEDVIEARRELAVTPDQVRAAAAKWLHLAAFVRAVIGPAPS
ncbi:insulinase family protein [bacterium]|nr:MAG: insulinase family protein [bacterium]